MIMQWSLEPGTGRSIIHFVMNRLVCTWARCMIYSHLIHSVFCEVLGCWWWMAALSPYLTLMRLYSTLVFSVPLEDHFKFTWKSLDVTILMSAGTCWRLSAQRPDRASLSSCWIFSSTLRLRWRICSHELSCVLTPCQVSGLHSVGVTFSALKVLSSALYQVLPRLWKGLKTE